MNELTYLPVCDRNGEHFEIGLIIDGHFTPLYSDYNSGAINCDFVNRLTEIDSIKVSVDAGTATFRKRNSKYWYSYKKLKGKLNNVYIGTSESFTELSIVNAVEVANTPKSVVQNQDCTTAKDKPLVELEKKTDDLAAQLTAQSDKYRNHGLAVAIAKERIEELEETIFKLECEASKQEEYFLGYKFCAEQDHDQLHKLECKFEEVKYCINQHRELANGKTRQGHPRFNKLLDFLEDIDKVALSI